MSDFLSIKLLVVFSRNILWPWQGPKCEPLYQKSSTRLQRKLILPLALPASCNQHLLAHKSFLLAPKQFFTSFFSISAFTLCTLSDMKCDTSSCLCRFHFVRATFRPQEFIRNLKHLSYSSFVISILRKIFACPSGKLSTELTSPITKSTSPGLSDMAFFACWAL